MSNCLAIFGVLLISRLVLAQTESSCTTKLFEMTADYECNVNTAVEVDFDIKTVKPFDKCDETKTVCIQLPSRVDFSGTFSDGSILTIYGLNKTAQLPVVVSRNRSFASPSVASFPSAEALPFDSALTFEVPHFVEADATYTGCTKATAGSETKCETTALCCLITERNLTLWGTVGSQKFVSFSRKAEGPVYIPLIVKATTDMDPYPLMLSTQTEKLVHPWIVEIQFLAEGVNESTTALTQATTEHCTSKCYEISKTPTGAIFRGKFPAEPVTYTISNDQNKIIYKFGIASAATTVATSGPETTVRTSVAHFVSPIKWTIVAIIVISSIKNIWE